MSSTPMSDTNELSSCSTGDVGDVTPSTPGVSAALRAQDEMPKRMTVVFGFDTPEQRRVILDYVQPMFLLDEGLRVCGLAVDSEMTRTNLIEQALERYRDGDDLRDAIEEILGCPNLSQFSFNDGDGANASATADSAQRVNTNTSRGFTCLQNGKCIYCPRPQLCHERYGRPTTDSPSDREGVNK